MQKQRLEQAQQVIDGIFAWGGRIKVESGRLLVAPVEVAQAWQAQIRMFKSEILILGVHCPVCAAPLRVTQYPNGQIRECAAGHYDEFRK